MLSVHDASGVARASASASMTGSVPLHLGLVRKSKINMC
jgi:hypothetical protein